MSIFHFLRRELTPLLTCGRHSLASGTENDNFMVVELSCEEWFDLTSSFTFESFCLLRFYRKFRPTLVSHYKPVKKWSIFRRTTFGEQKIHRSSIKKRSTFGELTVRPVKNGLKWTACLKMWTVRGADGRAELRKLRSKNFTLKGYINFISKISYRI